MRQVRYLIRFAALLASALLFVSAATAQAAGGRDEGPVKLNVRPVAFAPFLPGIVKFDRLEWRGSLVISSSDDRFGGYSGLVLSTDGTRLIAVSDRGWWLTADISYDEDGWLASLDNAVTARLLGPNGKVIRNDHAKDAEGLAVYDSQGIDGRLLVALERRERILLYDFGRNGFRAVPKTIPLPAIARQAEFNKELEAVGRFGAGTRLDGTVIALSEQFLDDQGNIRGWLIDSKDTRSLTVRRSNDFDITDLAILPDGDMLILERRFNAVKLAGMRIRRIAGADIAPDALLDGETLLEANQPLKTIDNMEGIAVHTHAGGETRITIISDDNFNPLQRTLLMQFALPDDEDD